MYRHAPCIGIDEVGRGAWAGPFVACALLLNKNETTVRGVQDSKLLPARRREELSQILHKRHAVGIGIVTVEELDQWGMTRAQTVVFERALATIWSRHPELDSGSFSRDSGSEAGMTRVLIDGRPIKSHPEWTAIIDGDATEYAIAAASIVAKVHRDAMMRALHDQDGRYRFDLHKGYGTPLHHRLLEEHGPCVHHRRLFEPIRKMLYS